MELAEYHPHDTYNFEAISRFAESLCPPPGINKVREGLCFPSSEFPSVFTETYMAVIDTALKDVHYRKGISGEG
jgi:hypothetical protein